MNRALPIYCFNWPSHVSGADTKFVIWSSEMMWHHAGESAATRLGLMDKVLHVSEV